MNRLILFEGIASSGKTTLERKLQETLPGSTIISEGRTLLPIFENKDHRLSISHLAAILDELEAGPSETYIVDRFHLTQAFRTKSPLDAFCELEQRLHERFVSTLIFLHMQETAITHRIQETDVFRAGSWLKKKQGTYEERTAYYTEQQRVLYGLVTQSILPTISIDTTDKDWDRCISDIRTRL